jgi:starch phosphorylase
VISSPLGHRVPVLMLDTDLPENAEPDRRLTDHLYGGDHEYRLRQEMVLGIGGLRTLQALGFTISRYHLNEGHAALLALDLLRRYPRPADMVAEGDLGFNVGSVRESCIFTTHTPVEAGHDRFAYDLVERLMPDYFPIDQLKRLAGAEDMNMTRLALNLSGYVNGVAVKHAEVTGKMFPGYRVRAITNGVHLPTWTHPSFARLFNRHVPSWGVEPEILSHVDEIADAEIWDAHADAKREFVSIIEEQGGIRLDPEIPIIGFARRITAYKRPALLFSDISRLCAIHAKTPFQIVVAGKAHPHDEPGKQLLETIHQALDQLNAANIRAVLLPNYNMALAKYLISGVDVWLNTPTPPMEASGTSGMKAAVNGVLNLSVLDGWWLEACVEGATGWAIGHNGGRGGHGRRSL